MNDTERRQIIETAIDGQLDAIRRLDPSDKVLDWHVETLGRLVNMRWTFHDAGEAEAPIPGQMIITQPVAEVSAEMSDEQKPVVEEAHAHAPADAEVQYTMAEVRAALAKGRGKGVDVTAIIRSTGATAFPKVPEEKYGFIMDQLKEKGVL